MDGMLILFNIVAFLSSGIFHEQAHARVALWLGDPTGRNEKRLSWDPRVHIDPIMTLVVPLISLFSSGGRSLFGMMKPVPIGHHNFNNPTLGMAVSALAGPISNAILAGGALLLLWLLYTFAPGVVWSEEDTVLTVNGFFLCVFIQMNFILGGFNLLPLPGLDGSHVLYHFLPEGGRRLLDSIRPYALLITMLIVFNVPGLMSSVHHFYNSMIEACFGHAFLNALLRML